MKKRWICSVLTLMMTAGLLTGCGSSSGSAAGTAGELNIFVWTEYVPDSVIEKFEEETGITVNVSTYSSNEDMLAKVKSESEGAYDVVLPSDYMIEQMIAQDMLEGKAPMGRKVLVVGGGMVGCEAAEFLAERGHEVGIIEMKDVIASDVTPENRRYMFENFRNHQVLLMPGAKVGQFYADGVDYTLADGTAGSLRGYDSVVLATGDALDAALAI